jgi:hypothetical protein
MKHLTALYPPPCVEIETVKAPPFVDVESGKVIDFEKEMVTATIEQMFSNPKRRKP